MDYLTIPNSFTTFASLEPAKPLYNAQIGGSFFYYMYMKTSFMTLLSEYPSIDIAAMGFDYNWMNTDLWSTLK